MNILRCNNPEQLRDEIVRYLEWVSKRERNHAILQRTQKQQAVKLGRALLAEKIAFDIRTALLHKDEQ